MIYRQHAMPCLVCGAALDARGTRLQCTTCRSALLPIAELESALSTMIPKGRPEMPPVETLLVPSTGEPRHCPRCQHLMRPHALGPLAVDRCAAHGVWFDGDELAAALLWYSEEERTRPSGPPLTAGDVARGVVYTVLGVAWAILTT
jgi:hypothetical protein